MMDILREIKKTLQPTGSAYYGLRNPRDFDYYGNAINVDYIRSLIEKEKISFDETEYANGIRFEHEIGNINLISIPEKSLKAMELTSKIFKFLVESGNSGLISDKNVRYLLYKTIFTVLEYVTR